MHVELVKTTTADGLRLDGAWQAAGTTSARQVAIDALLCLHGVGSTFYGATLLEGLVQPLLDLGVGVLRVNTRGHDTVSLVSTPGGPRRLGASYEIVDECRYDVSAWLGFLADRGCSRVAVLGHSLGAIKALYAAAHSKSPALRAVIAASPPRLSYSRFLEGPQRDDFQSAMATAETHVREGRPQALFDAKVPFPLLVGAAAYIDKYGPRERYDVLQFANRVSAPVLFLYGAVELERGGVAFAGLPQALRSLPSIGQEFDWSIVPDGDHFYTGVRDVFHREVVDWLQRRFGTRGS